MTAGTLMTFWMGRLPTLPTKGFEASGGVGTYWAATVCMATVVKVKVNVAAPLTRLTGGWLLPSMLNTMVPVGGAPRIGMFPGVVSGVTVAVNVTGVPTGEVGTPATCGELDVTAVVVLAEMRATVALLPVKVPVLTALTATENFSSTVWPFTMRESKNGRMPCKKLPSGVLEPGAA